MSFDNPVNPGLEHPASASNVIPSCPDCGGAMELLGLERWVGWRCAACAEIAAAAASASAMIRLPH